MAAILAELLYGQWRERLALSPLDVVLISESSLPGSDELVSHHPAVWTVSCEMGTLRQLSCASALFRFAEGLGESA